MFCTQKVVWSQQSSQSLARWAQQSPELPALRVALQERGATALLVLLESAFESLQQPPVELSAESTPDVLPIVSDRNPLSHRPVAHLATRAGPLGA